MTFLAHLAVALLLLQFNPATPDTEAIATFAGVFKSADKKFVTVEVEGGQTMRMYITRSTRFVRNGMAVKVSEFHEGDKVNVDASRDARLNLIAVRIEAASPPKIPGPKPDR